MWTPERTARPAQIPPAAELGQVTLSGDPAGVSLGGERRWLPVYSPGGYCWKPAAGDRVLVLHTGPDQELPCVAGAVQPNQPLQPGEVRISGGDSQISLERQALRLDGNLLLNGVPLDQYIQAVVTRILQGEGEP